MQRFAIDWKASLRTWRRSPGLAVVAVLALGIGIGILLALALSRVLAAALEVVQPAGPATLSAIAATLGLTALLALWRPLRRALALPPVAGLRMD